MPPGIALGAEIDENDICMLMRRRLQGLSRMLLAAMLFAHAALAFSNCELGGRAPALAMAKAMACCPNAVDEPSVDNANLCLAHCTSDSQQVEGGSGKLPLPLAAQAVLVLAGPQQLDDASSRCIDAGPPATATPSRNILFKNLRI